jgi:putative SOS response-associated peptidase YedK
LVKEGRTCLIALDGFFEWKQESVVGSKGKGKKQPYFVYGNQRNSSNSNEEQPHPRPFLLMAGLWTRVSTGRTETSSNNGIPSLKMLDTFTIITTEACPCLQWLHTRMPVFVWDDDLARQWLLNPSQRLHQQLVQQAKATTAAAATTATTTAQQQQQQHQRKQDNNSGSDRFLDWHAVKTEMSTMKYRSADSIKPLPKVKTVKSFFTTAAAAAQASSNNNNKNKSKSVSTGDDKKEENQLQQDAVAVAASTPTRAAGSPPLRKRPTAAVSVSSNQQQPSGKKSKTVASTKKATSSSSSSSPPKKGSIPFFFAPKANTEKK